MLPGGLSVTSSVRLCRISGLHAICLPIRPDRGRRCIWLCHSDRCEAFLWSTSLQPESKVGDLAPVFRLVYQNLDNKGHFPSLVSILFSGFSFKLLKLSISTFSVVQQLPCNGGLFVFSTEKPTGNETVPHYQLQEPCFVALKLHVRIDETSFGKGQEPVYDCRPRAVLLTVTNMS